MKLRNPQTNGVIVASESAAQILLSVGYFEVKEPVPTKEPAPEAKAKPRTRKTSTKKEV